MTQLPVTKPDDVIVRADTGELIALTNPNQVAEYLHQLRAHIRTLHQVRAMLEDLLVQESERLGTKTLRLGKVTATVAGGTKTEWDVQDLHELLEAGLPQERFNDLITIVVEEKVNARVAKQLEAANPDYATIIQRARRTVDTPVRVNTA